MINRKFTYSPYYGPINVPSSRGYINPLNRKKKPNLKHFINSTERSVDTISSFIPLYKKVKPVMDQGKTFVMSATDYFKNFKKKKPVEHVEAEVVSNNYNEKKEEKKADSKTEFYDYHKNETSSRPFFYL